VFLLEPALHRVTKGGEAVSLSPKALDTLAIM
jgi:hypothetical protein